MTCFGRERERIDAARYSSESVSGDQFRPILGLPLWALVAAFASVIYSLLVDIVLHIFAHIIPSSTPQSEKRMPFLRIISFPKFVRSIVGKIRAYDLNSLIQSCGRCEFSFADLHPAGHCFMIVLQSASKLCSCLMLADLSQSITSILLWAYRFQVIR